MRPPHLRQTVTSKAKTRARRRAQPMRRGLQIRLDPPRDDARAVRALAAAPLADLDPREPDVVRRDGGRRLEDPVVVMNDTRRLAVGAGALAAERHLPECVDHEEREGDHEQHNEPPRELIPERHGLAQRQPVGHVRRRGAVGFGCHRSRAGRPSWHTDRPRVAARTGADPATWRATPSTPRAPPACAARPRPTPRGSGPSPRRRRSGVREVGEGLGLVGRLARDAQDPGDGAMQGSLVGVEAALMTELRAAGIGKLVATLTGTASISDAIAEARGAIVALGGGLRTTRPARHLRAAAHTGAAADRCGRGVRRARRTAR